MSTRLFAVLFTALFLIGIFPMLFARPFGSASAGVTAGFLALIDNARDAAILCATGIAGAWLAGDAILFLPLCTLLMLIIGALTEITGNGYHALHSFILGGIILFSLCVSLLRNKSLLFYITPLSVWAFFTGDEFMHAIPHITTPLFFMMGIIVASALAMAIGVAFGITFSGTMRKWSGRFKVSGAFVMLLSLF